MLAKSFITLFSKQVSRLFICLSILCSVSAHADTVWLACIDCYGTASMYPTVFRELFPEKDIRWIHLRTEDLNRTESYKRSWTATRDQFSIDHFINDPTNAAQMNQAVRLLQGESIEGIQGTGVKVRGVVGGMETGAYHADWFNFVLSLPGNNPLTREVRRFKGPMQEHLAELAIPTLHTADRAEILNFVSKLTHPGVVIKPNGSSAGEKVEFAPRDNPQAILAVVDKMLFTRDHYGQLIDTVIVEPEIVGSEIVANSYARDGKVTVTAIWRYFKLKLPNGRKVYFLDRPVDLNSALGKKISALTVRTHQLLENNNAPGHTEFIHDETSDTWHVLEQGQRTGGSGVGWMDGVVWGMGQMQLHALAILDPVRYEIEAAKFPRQIENYAAMMSLVSRQGGTIAGNALDVLRELPGYTRPAPHFELVPNSVFDQTIDLDTSPGTIHFANPQLENIQQSARRLVQEQAARSILQVSCSDALAAKGHEQLLLENLNRVYWED